jgi:tetratricopeptide (TPR) repeat protein
MVLIGLGQFSEANGRLLDAYRLLRQMGDHAGEADSLIHLGVIAAHHRAYGEALAYLNRGLVIQKSQSALDDSARTLYHMGTAHLARQEYDDAMSVLIQGRSILRSVGTLGRFAEVEIALAEVIWRRGDSAQAARRLSSHLDVLRHEWVNDFLQPGMAYWRAAQILDANAQPDEAQKLREVFRLRAEREVNALADTAWRKAYLGIWYHAALLGVSAARETSLNAVPAALECADPSDPPSAPRTPDR